MELILQYLIQHHQGITSNYFFNATVTDNEGLDTTIIQFDDVNFTIISGSSLFSFNITNLSAGVYNYVWWTNDTSGNTNHTELQTYTIVNATGDMKMLINDTAANQTIFYLTQTNVSANSSYGTTTLLKLPVKFWVGG